MCPPVNAGGPLPANPRGIQRELVALLLDRGREDLVRDALDRVGYTDDGSTIYVHILPKPSWLPGRTGRAYALAFADRDELASLVAHRALWHEARLLLRDEIDDIVRWFDGG